jgi:3-oxoacyl-ACP reductase-like protein
MSVLGDIISKIFSHASAAPSAPATTPAAAPAGAPAPASTSPAATPVDVTAILDKLAAQSKEKLDWRHSIVDMMKLLNLDSASARANILPRNCTTLAT